MYYPYFRGKQYDLIAIRDSAKLIAESKFVPIIEPVKEALGGLKRALIELHETDAESILIVNPVYGDHNTDSAAINLLLNTELIAHKKISPGVLLVEGVTIDEIIKICQKYPGRLITLIHAGFREARSLAQRLTSDDIVVRNVFVGQHCKKPYIDHFASSTRILLEDGFTRRTANRLHPPLEVFSDLHLRYKNEGLNGFGDFLIVGDEYSETGGPAYSVAIHLTFIDSDNDNVMYMHHFKSDRNDTPTDPAGKFAEALKKLVEEVTSKNTKIYRSKAVNEFIDLHNRGHFPGLGQVKKLSMNHHIETLAYYLNK